MSSSSWWKGRRKRVRVVVEVGLFVAAYWALSAWQTSGLLPDGYRAPALQLSTVQGESFNLESLRGKRVFLHFWATWCGVCRQEHEALNAVYDSLSPDEALVSVVLDAEQLLPVEIAMAEGKVRYPVLLGTEQVAKDFRITAFPTNYFLNAAGEVASSSVGMSTRLLMGGRLGCAR